MSAEHHDTGKAYLPNLAPGVSPAFEPVVQSGRALELGATNDLAIPIHYTLGADDYDYLSMGVSALAWDGTTLSCDGTGADSDNSAYIRIYTNTTNTRTTVAFSFTASITAGSWTITNYYENESPYYVPVNYTVVDGHNEVIIDTRDGQLFSQIMFNGSVSFSMDLSDITIKPVEVNSGSFLTYHDIANDEIIQLGNAVDGGSSKELVTNGTFDSNLDGWTATGSSWVDGRAYIDGDIAQYAGISQSPYIIGRTYITTVTVENVTGAIDIDTAGGRHFGVSTGTHTFIETATATDIWVFALHGGDQAYVDNVSIKEVLPTSTEYILNDVTVNNILTHKMPFSAGDLNLIQQEPNTLAAFAMGEATPISSVTLDADDSWYACSEVSGAEVFDARVAGNDTTISGDLTSVRITNQQKGLQTTALLLDANGVPESYNSTPNTVRVYDDTIISTGFRPSIARYSIEESVSGELQDFELDSKQSATSIPSGVVES